MYDLFRNMTGPRRNLPKPIYEFLQNTDSMDRTRVLIRANIINQLQSAENELHKGNPTRARSHYRFMLKQMEKYLEKGLEKNPDHPIRPPAGVERWFAWEIAEKKRLSNPRYQCCGKDECGCPKHEWVTEAYSQRRGKQCSRCHHKRVNYSATPSKYEELTPRN